MPEFIKLKIQPLSKTQKPNREIILPGAINKTQWRMVQFVLPEDSKLRNRLYVKQPGFV